MRIMSKDIAVAMQMSAERKHRHLLGTESVCHVQHVDRCYASGAEFDKKKKRDKKRNNNFLYSIFLYHITAEK